MEEFRFDLELFKKYKDWIIIAALFILVAFIIFPHLNIESVWPDEALYVTYVDKLDKNVLFLFSNELAQFVSYVPIAVAAILNMFIGNAFLSGKLTILLFSILAVVSTYLLGKELKNEMVGLLAALFLSFLPLFSFLSSRFLLDVPVTAMITFTMYALIRYERTKSLGWAVTFGASIFLTFLTKNSALPILAVIGLYWLITRNKGIIADLKNKNTLVILAFGAAAVLFLGLRQISFSNLQPLYGFKPIFTGTALFYVQSLSGLFGMLLTISFIIGLVALVLNLKKLNRFSVLFLLILCVYLALLSFVVPEKDPRYMLPIVPVILITAASAFGIFKTDNKMIRYALYGVGLFIVLSMIGNVNALTDSKADSYLGFQEAGAWLRQAATNDSEIYAGSVRSMRAFSGFDFAENGGIVYLIPDSNNTFFEHANESNKKIFIEVDMWEYTQPNWTYPLSQPIVDSYIANGFVVSDIVFRNISNQKIPAVVIFSKNVVNTTLE